MIGKIRRWFFLVTIGVNLVGGIIIFSLIDLFTTIKIIYYLDFVVFPILMLALIATERFKTGKFPKHGWKFISLSVLAGAFYIYATHIEPYQLEVKEISLNWPGLESPMTIAHLSDIQSDGIDAYEIEALQKVANYNPDLIIHTGDLIQMRDREERQDQLLTLAGELSKLADGKRIWNVIGDTDWQQELELLRFDDLAFCHTLVNETRVIQIGENKVAITGFSLNTSRDPDRSRFDQMMDYIPEVDLNLLIGHAPDYALHLSGEEPVLALAGHTHGGQVRIPLWGPMITLSRVPRDWARGHTVIGLSHLNVSAGIGAEHAAGLPSIRANCPPEFTIIHLQPVPTSY